MQRKSLSAFAVLLLSACLVRADSEIGVIVMAEPGPRAWTKMVTRAIKEAEMPYPTHVFFGSGDTSVQQGILQDFVRDLEDNGAHTLIIMPLSISPYTQAYRQWKYLFGSDIQPGFNNTPLFPITKHSSIRLSEPLNDSAVVVEILLDRIQEISRKPAEESVIIVTPGPRDTGDNDKWMEILKRLSARLKERGKYRSVEAATLRDDAPSEERQRALMILRKKVEAVTHAGAKALVVPLVLSSSGIEHKISLELRGIPYSYNNKTLLPDSRISEWLRSQLP